MSDAIVWRLWEGTGSTRAHAFGGLARRISLCGTIRVKPEDGALPPIVEDVRVDGSYPCASCRRLAERDRLRSSRG